jgi:hypothetical protein
MLAGGGEGAGLWFLRLSIVSRHTVHIRRGHTERYLVLWTYVLRWQASRVCQGRFVTKRSVLVTIHSMIDPVYWTRPKCRLSGAWWDHWNIARNITPFGQGHLEQGRMSHGSAVFHRVIKNKEKSYRDVPLRNMCGLNIGGGGSRIRFKLANSFSLVCCWFFKMKAHGTMPL